MSAPSVVHTVGQKVEVVEGATNTAPATAWRDRQLQKPLANIAQSARVALGVATLFLKVHAKVSSYSSH